MSAGTSQLTQQIRQATNATRDTQTAAAGVESAGVLFTQSDRLRIGVHQLPGGIATA